ncbi:MAG TPA: gliding motility protein GldM [Cytophagaceae bacterium]|jgi:gliding motility-associated protein GldM|nr:gliding motility protein GldM [Cytophagaceae bacterium]
MASSKESPRQKMIGMMYLVLTALLALQVSSALIYKFQALNTSLEKTVETTVADNRQRQATIQKMVEKRGKRATEVKLSEDARLVHLKTEEMLGTITQLKKELIDKTGGYNNEGGFKGANEETEVEVVMIGANENSGKAYKLKKELDEYVTFMNKYSTHTFESLARNAIEDPTLRNNSDQKNKDYAHLNFGQTPMVAALAVLSETEAKIAQMENTVITGIYRKIGIDDYSFDRIKPMVKTKSDFVVAGTKYQAELFMVATSSSLQPKMKIGNSPIQVNQDGVGTLSFVASGGNYRADGTIEKTFSGNITMKKPNGEDTTYTVVKEYTVVKPTIQIQSSYAPALYRNCDNKLTISVPALGAEYNPTFQVEGATLLKENGPGNITLIPTSHTVKLGVSNNGNFIGHENFRVKLIPLPTIDVKVNNKKVPPLEGISYKDAKFVSIKVVPDKEFSLALPRECNYYISEGKIYLVKGKKAVGELQITGQSINLNSIVPEMKAGSRLVIEVSKVKRVNARNLTEEVPISKYYETIVLN